MAATAKSIESIRLVFPRMLSDMKNYRNLLADTNSGGLSGLDKNIKDAEDAWKEFNKIEESDTNKPGD